MHVAAITDVLPLLKGLSHTVLRLFALFALPTPRNSFDAFSFATTCSTFFPHPQPPSLHLNTVL